MVDCHACSWRLLRAICRDGPLTPAFRLGPRNIAFRSYSYNSSSSNGRHLASEVANDSQPRRRYEHSKDGRAEEREELAVALPNSNSRFDIERSSVHNHLKRELPWLKDPLKLLERTRILLEEGNQFKALELVRMASKEGQVAICWNRIIQHLLQHQKIDEAMKVFNEMKKRAQFPDAFTYSIILKGLSETPRSVRDAVPTALSIFNSMTGPTSRVRPGIVHTNSALRVCARKGDLDAMWAIASTIPERGPQAANATTYTTILNALRFNAERQPTNIRPTPLVVETQEKAVLQARQIWEDIAGKWYRGEIIVDEALVCAMGYILLMGSRPQDWDDIFSLVEQTTNIWRQAPHLRSEAKTDYGGKVLPPPAGQSLWTPAGDDGPDAGGEFDPVPQSISLQRAKLRESKSATLRYVKPSNNMLSLLLEASLKLFQKRTASSYWKIVTDPEGLAVEPDEHNFHAYLRILRQARGSTQAVKLVRDQMGHCEPRAKTFRLAMSTCLRNRGSPSMIRDASDLMDLMQARMPQMDVRTCIMWLELSIKSPHATDVYAAVERLGPQNIDLMAIARTGDDETRADVVKLMMLMLRCNNRFMSQRSFVLREEQRDELGVRNGKLESLISKIAGNEEWRSQARMGEEDVGALRVEKQTGRFTRKKDIVHLRKRKLDIRPSQRNVNDSRTKTTKTSPQHAVRDLYRAIKDSESGLRRTKDEKVALQAIKNLKQGIERLKKTLPDTPNKTAKTSRRIKQMVVEDAFPEFEHELAFK